MDSISTIPALVTGVLEGIVLLYFIYTVLYSLVFSIGAFFYRQQKAEATINHCKLVVLIPAYKEDSVIVDTARQAVTHDYPHELFDVVVIADSLLPETITSLKEIDKLITTVVHFENSTKVKALRTALANLEKTYDAVVILDADNIMQPGFLKRISEAYVSGLAAIQGQRTAKNKNTSMAVLDGVSEAINNRIYRQGTTALGFSCSFIGSGMAVDFSLIKTTLEEMKSVGGFDRDMEVRLIDKGYRVQYVKEAIVLDEKVDSASVFKNQRKRWIYSQYHYLWTELGPGFKKLFSGNVVYFNSAVLRNIQLPRLINIGLLFILSAFTFFFPTILSYPFTVWSALFLLLIFSNIIAIPRKLLNADLLKALVEIPKIFLIMFGLLFKLKGSNKKFIHTPHNK